MLPGKLPGKPLGGSNEALQRKPPQQPQGFQPSSWQNASTEQDDEQTRRNPTLSCYHPIDAWKSPSGIVYLNKDQFKPHASINIATTDLRSSQPLQLPCGTCLGCVATRAQHWALRCRLEAAEHQDTCVTTLTYSDEHVPVSLDKRHLQLWVKKLRKLSDKRIRYFGCGEYGERFGRPHYHVIIFGLNASSSAIADAWRTNRDPNDPNDFGEPLGITYTDNLSPQAISYVTGYTVKKQGWRISKQERMDPETGELYIWQPPFQLMSRRPGLGATARKYYQSWALYAVQDGSKLSVPRFYKASWDQTATPNEKEETDQLKYEHALTRHTATTRDEQQQQLQQQERNHYAKRAFHSALRRYG